LSDKEIIGSESDNLIWSVSVSHSGPQITGAVKQNVLIVDCRKTFTARNNRYCVPVVLIVQDAHIPLGGKREDRVFHARHVIFEIWQRIENIAREKIVVRMPDGEKWFHVISTIVISGTVYRDFTHGQEPCPDT
jgi:hypothetical protein